MLNTNLNPLGAIKFKQYQYELNIFHNKKLVAPETQKLAVVVKNQTVAQ